MAEIIVRGENTAEIIVQGSTPVEVTVDGTLRGPEGKTGPQGNPGVGVPPGGDTHQVWRKKSPTDYDGEYATLVKSDVGLDQVDNTADLNKPISTTTQTALDAKMNASATTANVPDSTDKRYVTDAQRTILTNTSGTNTGDQDLSGLTPKTRQINGHALTADITITKSDVGLGSVTNDVQLKAADLDTDTALAANSDAKIPSQKAVKAYTDTEKSRAMAAESTNASAISTETTRATSAEATKIQLGGDIDGTITTPTVPKKRVKDIVTVDKDGSYKADFSCSNYASDAVAINAAITAATTAGAHRHVKLLGDASTIYILGGIPSTVVGGSLVLGTLTTVNLPDNFKLEAMMGVTLKLMDNPDTISGVSNTLANPKAIQNANTTSGNTDITLINLNCDGNGANQRASQNTGGVFLNLTGATNLRYESVTVQNSRRFNSFIGTVNGATISGALALTINSQYVVGTGTSFLSQLTAGQRIRSGAGNLSFPIEYIIDDTHLKFVEPWPYTTEATSSSCHIVQGVRITTINSYFGTTYENDTFGGGGWDNSYFSDCRYENAQGYGFGTTSMYNSDCIGLKAKNNFNGFGLERVARSRFMGGGVYYNSQNGVNLVNGCHNNHFVGIHAIGNNVGFFDGNTSSTNGYNSRNTFTACKSSLNQIHGFEFLGALQPRLNGCSWYNNNQSNNGSAHGLYAHSANGYNTDTLRISNCNGFDDQAVATQTRDIYLDTGCVNAQVDFVGINVISGPSAPNYSASLKVLGGGKQVNIISGTTRATNNYETYIFCNKDSFDHLLPRLNSIVDGHKVKYMYNGSGTPAWTFARSTSDSFGTLEDYTVIPQDGHFWIEWCWDNTTKRWFISGSNFAAAVGNVDTTKWSASDYSLVSWSGDPALFTNSTAPTAGVAQVVKLKINKATTITNIALGITNTPSGLSNCYVALYDSSKNLITGSQSADQSTNWSTSGSKTVALGTPVSVSAGYIYAVFWVGAATTVPTFLRAAGLSTANFGLSTANSRFATGNTGLTTTAPSSLSTFAASSTAYWAAVS